jgi:hypothetical protein
MLESASSIQEWAYPLLRERRENMKCMVFIRKERPWNMYDPNLTQEDLPQTHINYFEAWGVNKVWGVNKESMELSVATMLKTVLPVGYVVILEENPTRKFVVQKHPEGWRAVPIFRKPRISNLGEIVGWFQKVAAYEESAMGEVAEMAPGCDVGSLLHQAFEDTRDLLVETVKMRTGLPFKEIGKEVLKRTNRKWIHRSLNW